MLPKRKDDIVLIRHMTDFARKAVDFMQGRRRADLDSDEMLSLAIIHLIEMIGEAARMFPGSYASRIPTFPGI